MHWRANNSRCSPERASWPSRQTAERVRGILLPLAHVFEADPRAGVVVAPSDQYIGDPERFNSAIAAAADRTAAVPLTLVGAEADHAETEYGWIEPGDSLGGGVPREAGFVEKPCAARARGLHAQGFFWNTFTMLAEASHLWWMAEGRMPVQAAPIRACVAQGGARGPGLAHTMTRLRRRTSAAPSSRTRPNSASSAPVAAAFPTGSRRSGCSSRCAARQISIASWIAGPPVAPTRLTAALCHLAGNAVGRASDGLMTHCPLAVPHVGAQVRSVGNGFEVAITSDDKRA